MVSAVISTFPNDKKDQLTLDFTPGLLDRHMSLRDCIAAGVYQRGLGRVAIDLNQAPGNLSVQLSDDPGRNFSVDSLERYIEKTGDTAPVMYLVEKFLAPDAQPKNAQQVQALRTQMTDMLRQLEAMGGHMTSPFAWREQPSQISWRASTTSGKLSNHSSRKVERERAAGTDFSTIHGLSERSDKLRVPSSEISGVYPRAGAPKSKTQRLRDCLVSGPKTCAEMGAATGISLSLVSSLLQGSVNNGLVKVLRESKPFRYVLASQGKGG